MLVPAEVWNVVQGDSSPIVLIRPVGSEVALPIFIDPFQAHSILLGIRNERITGEGTSRPHTHDLFLAVFEELHASLARVEITNLTGGTYFGRLIVTHKDNEQEMVIDARPSDCIALAVRAKCPIYVDEDIVTAEGRIFKVEGEEITAKGKPESELESLKLRLNRALETEDYELAAQLRDRIKELENKSS